MVLKRKINQKNRINLPLDVMQQMNLQENDVVDIDVIDNRIIITKEKVGDEDV